MKKAQILHSCRIHVYIDMRVVTDVISIGDTGFHCTIVGVSVPHCEEYFPTSQLVQELLSMKSHQFKSLCGNDAT